MSKVFFETLRELLHLGPVGGWRWLSAWRRRDLRAQELFIQAVLQGEAQSDKDKEETT